MESSVIALVLTYIALKYYFLFGLIFFIVVGAVARSKNRSFIGWFLLSIAITPLFALIALVAVPRKPSRNELRQARFDGGPIRIEPRL